jgi:mannose-6-phosphate isomerase-like protein (cupin superfamily)
MNSKMHAISQKVSATVLLTFMLINFSKAQDATNKNAPDSNKFTIENCINHLDVGKSEKTAVGYQYWFIPQGMLEDGLTVKMSVVAGGKASHAPHKHAGDEIFYVLQGTAKFYLNGKIITGGPNTTFYCPENSEHGISNAGDQELKYLVIRKYPKTEK